jgi:GNAT superfamily N-acetyltransferase
MAIHVRAAESRDVDLYSRLQRVEFAWTLTDDAANHRRVTDALVSDPLPGTRHLVAEVDDRFAGYAVVQPFAPVVDEREIAHAEGLAAVLPQVAVVPSRRRHGVGAALLTAAETAATELGYGVLIAHIPESLRQWYSRHGWTDLPRGVGFAWIEPPSPRNAELLPGDAPPDVARVHTPFFEHAPSGKHCYDALALKMLPRSARFIVFAPYEVQADREARVRSASRSLMGALDANRSAFLRVPDQSKAMLKLSSMTREELLALRERVATERSGGDAGKP